MKTKSVQAFLRFMLLASLVLNVIGLFWVGHLTSVQFDNYRKGQALRNQNSCAGSYIYSDSMTWLARDSDNGYYYVQRIGTNDAISVLKVEDSYPCNRILYFSRDLIASWAYDETGRCGNVLLVGNGKGVFDKSGGGQLRKLSSTEIVKICTAVQNIAFGQSGMQKRDSETGEMDGDL